MTPKQTQQKKIEELRQTIRGYFVIHGINETIDTAITDNLIDEDIMRLFTEALENQRQEDFVLLTKSTGSGDLLGATYEELRMLKKFESLLHDYLPKKSLPVCQCHCHGHKCPPDCPPFYTCDHCVPSQQAECQCKCHHLDCPMLNEPGKRVSCVHTGACSHCIPFQVPEQWEDEFNKQFPGGLIAYGVEVEDQVKAFIHSLTNRVRTQERDRFIQLLRDIRSGKKYLDDVIAQEMLQEEKQGLGD